MPKRLDALKTMLIRPQTVATGTLSIMFFTLISKFLGFVREMVLAAQFGTSWRLDALIIAMDPALQISGIISSAMATMMIPIYIDIKSKKDPVLLRQYTTQTIFLSSFLLIIFGFFLVLFPDFFIKLFAPKFGDREMAYAISKLKFVGILPLINGLNILLTSILKAEKIYMAYSITQLLYNIVAIPVIICFAPFFSESSYLLAFISGTLAMDLMLFIFVRKKLNFRTLFKSNSAAHIRRTLFLAAPLMFSASLSVINNIVDKAFASALPPGSISSMRFAQTIRAMITSLIITSLMTTVFTELSETSAKKDMKSLVFRLNKTSTDLFNFLIPLTAWLIIVAQPLISLLLQRGAFTSDSTSLVSSAFLGYSLILILAPFYNLLLNTMTAYKKTHITFFMSAMSVGLNFLFNSLLIERFGLMGIALSSSLVNIFSSTILYVYLSRTFKIRFLNKKRIAVLCLVTIPIIIVSKLLESHMNHIVWLIVVNLVFALTFILFNRKILLQIMNKMLMLLKSKRAKN